MSDARERGRAARVEFGDWQTPAGLAEGALDVVARWMGEAPETVLEPTCGEGAFLLAAARRFPGAALVGYELNHGYAEAARAALLGERARVEVANFFNVDWAREIDKLRPPILVTGNPPWVTSADLGALGSTNLPQKKNLKGLSGYEALTGKSNFDVSEWMLLRLLEALGGRDATLAVLCKAAVARRVIELAGQGSIPIAPGGLFRIDAMEHFGAAVDAVLFVGRAGAVGRGARWPVYASLGGGEPEGWVGVVNGRVVADAGAFARTAHLAGSSSPEWRSGVKHDCARVMELERDGERWINGLGDTVDIEEGLIFPLLKSSDVANDRLTAARGMIVPQRSLGEDTSLLSREAPRAWAYLSKHKALLDARKSSVYRRQPPFSVFGVGPYSFAPWKVAVSGLYKRCSFALLGPKRGRPVMVDDTCYFLPFEDEASAARAQEALLSPLARDFFAGRVFWDSKRPISKAVLQSLDLGALESELGLNSRACRTCRMCRMSKTCPDG